MQRKDHLLTLNGELTEAMASNLVEMASNLLAMASNLEAMTSSLEKRIEHVMG